MDPFGIFSDRPAWREAFERTVLDLAESDKHGPFELLKASACKVEICDPYSGKRSVDRGVVLIAFSEGLDEAPEHLRVEISDLFDFSECVSYADIARIAGAVFGLSDPRRVKR